MADLLNPNEMFYTVFEPKVQNRFIFSIDGIPAFIIKKTDRPKLAQEKKTIDYINVQRYYKGKSVWNDITISLYDPIAPSGAQAVMEWVRLHHESVTGRDGYLDFYKKDCTINCLGPVGDKVEEWVLKGAQIVGAEFGSLDWTNMGDPVELTLNLAYDYAVLQF
jgi:hypothetical protein